MKTSFFALALYVALTASANAQEAAEWVQTGGHGELRRTSEQMIAPGGKSISISLPATVKAGEIIYIQYGSPGNLIADSFMVTGILIKDGNCAIESKRGNKIAATISDTIYAPSCKKLK